MMGLAALCLGLACFFNSYIIGPVTLFIGFFLIRYFGQGSMMLIPNTLVSQWFYKYRGRALSFAGLGGLLGAAVFPPLINALIDAYGWQSTWRILGTALMVTMVPLAFFLVRNRPEDVGLLPDGEKIQSDQAPDHPSPQEDSWTLSEAMRTRAFWLLMVCGGIPAMIITGITFQIFSILGNQGIDRMSTAFVLSLIPIVSFSCSLLSGFIVERVRAHLMLSFSFLLAMITPLILIFAQSYAVVILFAVAWGIAQGVMNIPMGVVWPNYYGRQHLGSIQSITHTVMVVGSALGPIPFGWAYDRYGDYSSMLMISAGIWGVGAVLAFLARPPKRRNIAS